MVVVAGMGGQGGRDVGYHPGQGRQAKGCRIGPTDKAEQQQRGDEPAFHQSYPTTSFSVFCRFVSDLGHRACRGLLLQISP